MIEQAIHNDLTALFEGEEDSFSSPQFNEAVLADIRKMERRRRWVLSGFGLFGSLIAGSQFPFLVSFLKRFQPTYDVSGSSMILGADISSLMLWLIIAIFGVATLALTTADTA
jgi:hypothetical protein